MTSRILKGEALAALPREWPHDLSAAIQHELDRTKRKVVVLDDDPTGTQTVHAIPVLTEWSVESLGAEFLNELPACFILTNSRSMPAEQARDLNLEIARNLLAASRQTNVGFVVVSRSDSTLRGHFPIETDALSELLGPFDATLIVPYFEAGGRYTIDDVHYLADGEWLDPVAQTEFARDVTFGFRHSNLRDWVEEKTGGRVLRSAVQSITSAVLRRGGPDAVRKQLDALHDNEVCIANIASPRDLEVLVLSLVAAEREGRRFLYRTAASFAAARAGIRPRPFVTRAELQMPGSGGGLIVVGSYVPKSSGQLTRLLSTQSVTEVKVDVRALLSDGARELEVGRAASALNNSLCHGTTTLLYTSRELVTGQDAKESLAICRQVSQALSEIVQRLAVRPRFVVGKGGITSSDLATKGLRVRRAMVLGQILTGVPIWQLGAESRWPGLIYVSFPGNIGGPDALVELVNRLVDQ